MSNPFTTPFTCTGCGAQGMEIDMFPGVRCIECHSASFDSAPPMTGAQVQAAFGQGVRL